MTSQELKLVYDRLVQTQHALDLHKCGNNPKLFHVHKVLSRLIGIVIPMIATQQKKEIRMNALKKGLKR